MSFFNRKKQLTSEERARRLIRNSSSIKPGHFLSGGSTKKYSADEANALWKQNYPQNQKVTGAYSLGIVKDSKKALGESSQDISR